MKQFTLIAISAFALGLAGCGSSGGGTTEGTPTNTAESMTGTDSETVTDDETVSASTGKYAGDYSTGCISAENTSDFNLTTMNITENTATQIRNVHSDSTCADQPSTSTTVWSFSFPGGTTSTELGEADNIDMTVTSYIISGVNFDYASGDRDDLDEYTIILLDGITLYPGNRPVNAGNSAENRNTELSPLSFTRQ